MPGWSRCHVIIMMSGPGHWPGLLCHPEVLPLGPLLGQHLGQHQLTSCALLLLSRLGPAQGRLHGPCGGVLPSPAGDRLLSLRVFTLQLTCVGERSNVFTCSTTTRVGEQSMARSLCATWVARASALSCGSWMSCSSLIIVVVT